MFIRFGGKIINVTKFKIIDKVGDNKIDIDEKLYELFATEKERDVRFEELENYLCGQLSDKVVNLQNIEKDKIYVIDTDGQPKYKGTYYVKYNHMSDFEEDTVLHWDGACWTGEDGARASYGNYNTRGEEYKLKELDSNQ